MPAANLNYPPTIGATKPAVRLHRVCPLLERPSKTRQLGYAPEPWVLQQCLETGLVYLENPPEYAAFQEEFAWEVTRKKEQVRRAADDPLFYGLRVWWKDLRMKFHNRNQKVFDLAAASIAAMPAGPLSLVELGCGEGHNLLSILDRLPADKARHCSPHGVEISKKLARQADDILKPLGGSCLQADALSGVGLFSDDSLDLIVLANFLEHEINPLPLLRGCQQKLRAGGEVVIKVPNYDCLARHVRGRLWCGFRWPDHVNYFTPQTLKLMIEAAGLQVSRMHWIDHTPTSDNMYAVAVKG